MPIVGLNNTDMWPSLIEAHNQSSMGSKTFEEEHHQQLEQKHHRQEDESGWEIIANASSIHRSVSTPNLSSSSIALLDRSAILEPSAEDDQSSDNSSFVELAENDTSIVVDQDTDCDGFVLPTPPHSPTGKPITAQSRTPSFRDAILLNALERQKEEEAKREEMEKREAEERLKQRRRSRQRKIVVVSSSGSGAGMRRCAKSTGDLRMMVKIEEVLGETDAPDYYDRKSAGRASRRNGQRLRPDEAKRKAGIVAKKNAQRRGQSQKKEEGKRNRR